VVDPGLTELITALNVKTGKVFVSSSVFPAFRDCLHALQARLDALSVALAHTRDHRGRRQLWASYNRVHGEKGELVKFMHRKVARALLDFGDIILLPRFETSHMVKGPDSVLSARNKRDLNDVAHYQLRRAIESMVRFMPGKTVVDVDEAYTTKSCPKCLHMTNIGPDRTFTCADEACGYSFPRDVHAAWNILTRTTIFARANAAKDKEPAGAKAPDYLTRLGTGVHQRNARVRAFVRAKVANAQQDAAAATTAAAAAAISAATAADAAHDHCAAAAPAQEAGHWAHIASVCAWRTRVDAAEASSQLERVETALNKHWSSIAINRAIDTVVVPATAAAEHAVATAARAATAAAKAAAAMAAAAVPMEADAPPEYYFDFFDGPPPPPPPLPAFAPAPAADATLAASLEAGAPRRC